MAKGKQIRAQIVSVDNTRKITDAMERVAASKMRAAQNRMAASRAYARNIRRVISHVANSHNDYRHPFMKARSPLKRVGVIVVSSDRGLCGSLNANLYRKILHKMREWSEANIPCDIGAIGRKGATFFGRTKGHVIAKVDQIGDTPQLTQLVGAVKVMLDSYAHGGLDAIWIGYNRFVNNMIQEPVVEPLLPLPASETLEKTQVGHWDYLYEPEMTTLLDVLLTRYIEMQVYQAVVENAACEQAARMLAMKNATDNANTMIKELRLAYNKARQAAITQEIAEIVAGADAV